MILTLLTLRLIPLWNMGLPPKSKKEREDESLDLLQVFYFILGYLSGLIDLDKNTAQPVMEVELDLDFA